MSALKRILPTVLVLAAVAVVIVTLLSSHDSKYGEVPLPAGGTVELPKGTVKVFLEEPTHSTDSDLAVPLSFQVTSADGVPVPLEATAKDGSGAALTQRSEEVTEFGSVAKLDVPEEDSYRVSGGEQAPAGSSLTFGIDSLAAVVDRWRLLAVLLGGAVVIALLPGPRRSPTADEASGWSSDPRTPYA
jgi:hypothetical protein